MASTASNRSCHRGFHSEPAATHCSHGRRRRRHAFTIIELLVALAVVGLLISMLLPAIQQVRQVAYLAQCKNNLKQMGIALHNYEGTHGTFPIGGRSAPGRLAPYSAAMPWAGVSFFVGLLPHIEETGFYNKLDTSSPACGEAAIGPNTREINGKIVNVFRCPVTEFEPLITVTGIRVFIPSYAGISGAGPSGAEEETFSELRTVVFSCPTVPISHMSWSGMLVANEAKRTSEAVDGLSHVMIIGECSAMGGTAGAPLRVEAGHQGGCWKGTDSDGSWPSYRNSASKLPTRCINLATLTMPINTTTPPDWTPQCALSLPDRPLSSAHSGGASVLMADGAVHFLSQSTAMIVLRRLATRDDGKAVSDFGS